VLPGPRLYVPWIHTKISRLGAVSATDLHAFELEWTSLRVSCDNSPPSYPTLTLVAAGPMGTATFSYQLADGTRVIMGGSGAAPTKGV
jgi:hypothetical protein